MTVEGTFGSGELDGGDAAEPGRGDGGAPVSGERWLEEIPVRRIMGEGLETRFALLPGDRPLVEPGSAIMAGDPLLEHLNDRRIDEVEVRGAGSGQPVPGSRWSPPPGRRRRDREVEGELLAPIPGRSGRWRLVTGDHRVLMPSPVAGVVTEVRPGSEIRVRPDGRVLRGRFAAGSAARGRLELATDPFGELRPGGIDVGRAGSILVVGSRIDAEALTRARAMGVRGIVVASLPGKELRDFQASERRQRAALHPAPPFGVLVLEGAVRRAIPSPIAALLERFAGRQVALLVDPPALVLDGVDPAPAPIDPRWVRVRSGPNSGAEGRLAGPAGLRRFAAGVHLEAAWVEIDGESAIAVPLGDLERYD
jgi:hypothetical protein